MPHMNAVNLQRAQGIVGNSVDETDKMGPMEYSENILHVKNLYGLEI